MYLDLDSKFKDLYSKLRVYQLTALFSILFALMGFSYNVWRLESNEHNSTMRTASFELFTQLAELEHLVFAAHYDHDKLLGNPRKGWVKVGLIKDLSSVTDKLVEQEAQDLHTTWDKHWKTMVDQRKSAQLIIQDIDAVRQSLRQLLNSLE